MVDIKKACMKDGKFNGDLKIFQPHQNLQLNQYLKPGSNQETVTKIKTKTRAMSQTNKPKQVSDQFQAREPKFSK